MVEKKKLRLAGTGAIRKGEVAWKIHDVETIEIDGVSYHWDREKKQLSAAVSGNSGETLVIPLPVL